MIRLVCIVEVEDADDLGQAERALDAFREAVQPSAEYGISLYRASWADVEARRPPQLPILAAQRPAKARSAHPRPQRGV